MALIREIDEFDDKIDRLRVVIARRLEHMRKNGLL